MATGREFFIDIRGGGVEMLLAWAPPANAANSLI